ncbi:MAG: gamma-glutamylcyclotransferase (GGCT)/AIG2-like uncharacterized protein YtfP [Acidimicrobiales bacterium]|jgi:gamma-glutamylcyclotransferase (GGCT)/AIG2-like uncharacterized protein YtfP
MKLEYLFTYGTLQPASSLAIAEKKQLKDDLKSLGSALIKGRLLHLRNLSQKIDYPGLVESDTPVDVIKGTLYQVFDPERVFTVMDTWEVFTPGLSPEESKSKNFYFQKNAK